MPFAMRSLGEDFLSNPRTPISEEINSWCRQMSFAKTNLGLPTTMDAVFSVQNCIKIHTQTKLLLLDHSQVNVDVWRRDKALSLSEIERRVYLALSVCCPVTTTTAHIKGVHK
jgi:hypothetical protein